MRPILYVGNSHDKSQDIWGHERIYIKFDLTPLPAGVFLISAVLRLYVFYAPKTDLPTALYKVTENWSEPDQTWINQASVSEIEVCRNVVGREVDVWVSWDVTALVRDWLYKSEGNFGAMIRAVSEERIRDHSAGAWSRQSGIAGKEPQLEVTYLTGQEQLSVLLAVAAVSLVLIAFRAYWRRSFRSILAKTAFRKF